jgi:hypothetical protein
MTVVESVNGKTGVVTLTASNVEAVPTSEVGKANGVASLSSSGTLPEGQLPTSVVSSSQGNFIPLKQYDPKWEPGHDSTKGLEEAITASIAAGGVPILLPAGEGEINGEPVIPANLTHVIPIRGCGKQSTIVKLTTAASMLVFGTGAVGGTVGNVEVSDLTINCNNHEGVSGGVVVRHPSGQERMNVENVTMRRVRVINCPTLEAEAGGRQGLKLYAFQKAAGEPLNEVNNILVEDFEVAGAQQGVYVGGESDGSNFINVRIRNVRLKKIRHIAASPPKKHGYGGNVQIGARCWSDGEGMLIEDVIGENSCDPGIEMDTVCTLRNAKIVNAYNNAFLFTVGNPTWTREPIVTKLTAILKAGESVIKVASTASFAVGERIGATGKEVRTIKAIGTNEIEVTEPFSFEWASGTEVIQIDDVNTVKYYAENLRAERTHPKEGGGGTCLGIQNFETRLPLPGVEIKGIRWRCAEVDSGGGELLISQPGSTSDANPQANPAFITITGIDYEKENLTYSGTSANTWQPISLVLLGTRCPVTLQGTLLISGPGATGTGSLEGSILKTERSQVDLDLDLLTRVAIGKTGGKPFVCFYLNSFAPKGELSARIRHRTIPSAIETTEAGSNFVGVEYGNARGFASRSLSTTLSAEAASGAATIKVESATPFAVGQWINIGTTENQCDVNMITAISGTELTLLMPTHYTHASGSAVAVLRNILVEDTDWSALADSFEPFKFTSESPVGGLAAVTKTRSVTYPSPLVAKTIGINATEKATPILTGCAGILNVTGVTVTKVEWSPDGKDWMTVSTTTGAIFPVQSGEAIKLTYSSAPTVTFYPTRT